MRAQIPACSQIGRLVARPEQQVALRSAADSNTAATPEAASALTGCAPIALTELVGTVLGMPYPSDLTDGKWELLEPVFNTTWLPVGDPPGPGLLRASH